MHLEFTAMLCSIRQLLGSPWLHSQQKPQVQGSTSYWKVMSHHTYTAGSHARLLWAGVCSCQTWAQLPTVALHSKSVLIAYTQPQGSYWNFSQYFQYLWTGLILDSCTCWNTNLLFQRCPEQIPGFSVPDFTFQLQRKFLDRTETSFRDIFLIICLLFIYKNRHMSIKSKAILCKFS